MYSLGVVLMYTQAVQADIERSIENYQMFKAATAEKKVRPTLRSRLAQWFRPTFEQVDTFSNSRAEEVKVAECT